MGINNGMSGWSNASAILSTLGSVTGQVAQAKAADQAADENKDELEAQARLAELDAKANARAERQQDAMDAEQLREEKQRRKARARAAWGKSGTAASGSAARVMDGIDAEYENRISDNDIASESRAKSSLAMGQERASIYRDRAKGIQGGSINPWAVGQSILGLGKTLFDK